MLRLVLSAVVFGVVLLAGVSSSDVITVRSTIMYGLGALDPMSGGGIQAIELPAGNLLGHVGVGGLTQGGAFALAPDGHHAYLLDREQVAGVAEWRLSELDVPSLRVLRRAVVQD